jgi:lysophospholipase L1-like esterase
MTRTLSLLAAACVTLVAARRVDTAPASLPTSKSATALPVLRVLPLGDSLTFGCGSDAAPPLWYACCDSSSGGYRAPLWAALNGSAINASVMMVGTVQAGPSWMPVDQRGNEGHPGWTISQINGLKNTWVGLQPDIVLLMAGTNDLTQGHSNATMLADYNTLLTSLRTSLPPAVRILIASIYNIVDSSADFSYTTRAFNGALPALAASYNATFVDINGLTGLCKPHGDPLASLCAVCNGPCGGYNPNACPPAGYSYVHPSGAGYSLVGGAWAGALLPVLEEVAGEKRGM